MPRPLSIDGRASAAIEFALLAPLLISLLLGMGDLAPAAMARFKSGNATQSVADLTTQFSQMQASDVVDVYSGGADVMAPFPKATLIFRITNLASAGNGNAFVYWSCGQGALPPYVARSTVTTTPTGTSLDTLMNRYNVSSGGYNENGTNTSLIIVESQYVYTAPTQFVLKTPQTMSSVSYMLPRVSSYIGFPWDGNSSDAPPLPTSTSHSGSVTLSNGAICNYAY